MTLSGVVLEVAFHRQLFPKGHNGVRIFILRCQESNESSNGGGISNIDYGGLDPDVWVNFLNLLC